MAAGSSVTWIHCSVRYKATSSVNRRVRADECVCPRGPNVSAWTKPSGADAGSLGADALGPRGSVTVSAWTREKK
jgi:hypothetical protein